MGEKFENEYSYYKRNSAEAAPQIQPKQFSYTACAYRRGGYEAFCKATRIRRRSGAVGQWGIVGLLHDVDFEKYPEQHCIKAPELLKKIGASDELIHAVCSHGYEITVDIKPEHEMEKVLFATDELTGLIGAAALMRPSKSVSDMELKSLKKKFKDKRFAAGCSREIITKGAEMLDWELDRLLSDTLKAMQDSETEIKENYNKIMGEEL